jgi:membrane-associated phospholipid phosphatase
LNQKYLNRTIINLVLLWAILAGYFAFTDLQISITLVDSNSGWARFLEKFGELPGLLVLYSGTFISLLYYLSGSHKFKLLFIPLLFLSATFLASYFTAIVYLGLTGNYFFVQDIKFYLGGVLLILNLFAVYRLRNIEFKERTLDYAGKTVLLGLFGYLVVIQPLKHLWGRVRFRDLDILYSNFTPWFLPNAFTGHESFPSGHSAMAWIVLPLLILVSNKGKIIRSLVLIMIMSWGLVVPLSRVMIGAHYASDALFGACIIILSYLIIISKQQFALRSEFK